jgi:2-methylisocitrate lyase-like PEP mutase family enzyme
VRSAGSSEVTVAFATVNQREKAELLRSYHSAPPILVLPNAWDAASAQAFAAHPACRAIATASAAVAPSLGYSDGEGTPPALMLAAVARIARAVDLPVTADLEAGYGNAAGTAAGAIEAGAVGLNLEDAAPGAAERLTPLAEQRERVAAVVDAGARAGVPLVVNARTDVYLAGVGEPEDRLRLALERARAYLDAGADCIFVPGVRDPETIRSLADGIAGRLSVLAGSGTPSVAELERLGVARVSVGPGPFRATIALLEHIAEELLGDGTYTAFT